jgi:hypothetical protein
MSYEASDAAKMDELTLMVRYLIWRSDWLRPVDAMGFEEWKAQNAPSTFEESQQQPQ